MRIFKAEVKWWWQRVKNLHHFLKAIYWIIKCGYPAKKLTVIGVTGTDGKTTTSTLIYEILKASGSRVDYLTTVNSKGLHTTNPDPSELQPLMFGMVKNGMTHLVLEVTAHGLDQYRVLGCNFYIGVLTNLTHEHLDDFVDIERYRKTKLKLFENAKYSVLNSKDENYEYFKKEILKINPNTHLMTYSETSISELSPSLAGEYNRQNVGAAEMVAKILAIDARVVSKVVKNFGGVAGRREEVKVGQDFRVIVDFAHTPNALFQVLRSLREEIKRKAKLIVVFGATGERDQTKRPKMGKLASEIADVVIVTSDDTRRESQDSIAKQIVAGIPDDLRNKVILENDRRKAIAKAVKSARIGDIILLAGKGHEKSLLLGTIEHEWSDVDEAKRAIMGA